MKLILSLILAFAPAAALAEYRYYDDSQPGWSSSQTCVKKVYREEYVPGTQERPGYVKTYYDEVKVSCNNAPISQPYVPRQPRASSTDPNCVRGSLLGGILGGGVAAGLSKPDAMIWSIPVGVVTGAIAGCEVQRN